MMFGGAELRSVVAVIANCGMIWEGSEIKNRNKGFQADISTPEFSG
jgi:hypothetical protein